MTKQMNAKVRLVRCPGCRLVLPELPEIPVYKCGGCGTVLQAKHRKPDIKDTELRPGEISEDGKKEPDNSSEKKEISHLDEECTTSSKGELSSDTSPSRSDDNFGDCNIKQAGGKSLSAELPVSPELSYHEIEDLSPKLSEQMEEDEGKGTLGQYTGEGENEFCDGDSEWQGGRNSSDDYPSSMELTYHETEDLAPEPQAHTGFDEAKSTFDGCTIVDKIEHGNSEREQDESSNFLIMIPSMIEDKPEPSDSSPKHGEHGEEDESLPLPQQDTSSYECRTPENGDCCRAISSSEVTCGPEKPSAVVEAHVEVDTELKGHIFESLKTEDTLDNLETDSVDAAESPLSEHISSDVLSPDYQHLKLSQKRIPQDSEGASSVDSEDNLLVTNSVCKLGLKHTDLKISSSEVTCGSEKPSAVVEAHVEVNTELKGHIFESLKTEDTLDNLETDSVDAAESSLSEHISSDVLSPDYQHLKLSQKIIPQDSEGASSVDSEDNLQVTNSVCELGLKHTDLKISSSEVTYEPEKPSAVVKSHLEGGKELKGHIFESLKAEDTLDNIETDSIDAAESPLSEHISSDNVLCPDYQHLELFQKIIPQDSEGASSVDSVDNLLVTNSISELGLKHTDLTKSPMTRSYYAYDGSVSSYDGIEDQNPDRFLKPSKRKFKSSNLVNRNGSHKHDESRVKDFLGSKAEMHYQGILETGVDDMLSSASEIRPQARKSLILQEKNHRAMKYTKHTQYDLPDPRSFGHSGGNRMRADQEEYAPQLPSLPRYSLAGQRNEMLSSYQYNGLKNYSGFHSPDAPSYAEPDKMELLRMVYELKDQLNRTHISNSRFPNRFATEKKHTPLFYEHLAPAEEMHADLHRSRYPGRCSQVKDLPQLHKMSRTAFSGDAIQCRQEVDCSCLYCLPQNWHCSVQLPSHATCCNNAHFMNHSSQSCYKGPYSTSSSPQHYTSSEFSVRGRETKSEGQRQHNGMKRLHVREIYRSTKQHLRPVAGGIPIVACFHCSELLQLPADFLLLGRRCHKLRCSACRKIMKFSLQSGRHLAPCIPDAIAPPPSMVGDCGNSIDRRDLVSASHSDKRPHTEPLSCSDDYGLSFDRSCSTEWETSQNILPVAPGKSNTRHRNISSVSSFKPSEDRKMKGVLVDSQMTKNNSMENF